MENLKEALQKTVRALRRAKLMDNALLASGYHNNPYGDIYEDLVDAVYALTGEKAAQLDQSVTWNLLNNAFLSPEDCTKKLLAVYLHSHGKEVQP